MATKIARTLAVGDVVVYKGACQNATAKVLEVPVEKNLIAVIQCERLDRANGGKVGDAITLRVGATRRMTVLVSALNF